MSYPTSLTSADLLLSASSGSLFGLASSFLTSSSSVDFQSWKNAFDCMLSGFATQKGIESGLATS